MSIAAAVVGGNSSSVVEVGPRTVLLLFVIVLLLLLMNSVDTRLVYIFVLILGEYSLSTVHTCLVTYLPQSWPTRHRADLPGIEPACKPESRQ